MQLLRFISPDYAARRRVSPEKDETIEFSFHSRSWNSLRANSVEQIASPIGEILLIDICDGSVRSSLET